MMINPMGLDLDQLHRQDMMRKAETIRRARDLQTTNRTARPTTLLARVGKALSTVGNHRQHGPAKQRHEDRRFVNLAQSH